METYRSRCFEGHRSRCFENHRSRCFEDHRCQPRSTEGVEYSACLHEYAESTTITNTRTFLLLPYFEDESKTTNMHIKTRSAILQGVSYCKSAPWLKTRRTQKTWRSSHFIKIDLNFSNKKELISKKASQVYLFLWTRVSEKMISEFDLLSSRVHQKRTRSTSFSPQFS